MEIQKEAFVSGMKLQLNRLELALQEGMPRRGWKIGINVPEVQAKFGLPHSGVGWVDGRRCFDSGHSLKAPAGARLHVEPELSVSMSETVGAGTSPEIARGLISEVAPALEVVDYALPTSGLDDAIGHCMFHHATVLGARAGSLESAKLGAAWPKLQVGKKVAEEPRSDLVPSDLGELVAFVANYLAEFGESLQANDIILSGSFTAEAVPLSPGESAAGDFGPCGTVTLNSE